VTYNDAPVVTYFFASSGGFTESIQNVWPGATPEPWLRGVPDPYDGAGSDPYHQWGYKLTVPSAAATLSGLVKGQFVGIQVLRHGVSPRILLAAVVGTKGRTTVTGAQLQQLFGLLTTYASFTTISTVVGSEPPSPPPSPTLTGTVFPGPPHRGTVLLQALVRGHGWRDVGSGPVSARGQYDVAVPGPGTFRVVYAGLDGPAVKVP
jgi:stage II sporulation protein D